MRWASMVRWLLPTVGLLPMFTTASYVAGVYAASAVLEGDTDTSPATYDAVVNIGNNPTVGNNHLTIEAHLINYQGDLYGKTITIALREYIRAERKFDSLQKLQEQIRKDIQSL